MLGAPRCDRNLEIFFLAMGQKLFSKLFFFVRNYATRRNVLFDLPHHSSELHKKADCTLYRRVRFLRTNSLITFSNCYFLGGLMHDAIGV